MNNTGAGVDFVSMISYTYRRYSVCYSFVNRTQFSRNHGLVNSFS